MSLRPSVRQLAGATSAFVMAAAVQAAGTIEVIGTSAGLPPPPPPVAVCAAPDCATVVSVVSLGRQWEQVKRMDSTGVYMAQSTGWADPSSPLSDLADSGLMAGSPAFSAQDEALAPMERESGMVRRASLWHTVVRFDDGTTRTLQQDFPPLFQAGTRVRVAGNRLQLAQ